jgi:hypothetical protein
MIIRFQCGESDFGKQFLNIDLLKDAYAQNRENGVNAGIQIQATSYNEQKSVYSESTPDLYFDRVWLPSVKCFDSDVHFKPFEKELNFPARFIKHRDREGRQFEVIGKKDQELACFRVSVNDTAQPFRVVLLGIKTCESNDLVGNNSLFERYARMASVELEIRFGTGDKERLGVVDTPETFKIDVSSVEQIEASCFKKNRVEPIDVMYLTIRDLHKHRQGTSEVELGVDLNCGLVRTEACPRKDRQAKVDGGRVNRVDCGLNVINPAGFVVTHFSSPIDKQQRELFEYSEIPLRVGVSQGTSGNGASKPKVIELCLPRSQTILNIAQTLPERKQCKCESQQVIPRGERRRFIVASILGNDPSEISLRKEIDDLREYETSCMHEEPLYSKSESKRFKSRTFVSASFAFCSKITMFN